MFNLILYLVRDYLSDGPGPMCVHCSVRATRKRILPALLVNIESLQIICSVNRLQINSLSINMEYNAQMFAVTSEVFQSKSSKGWPRSSLIAHFVQSLGRASLRDEKNRLSKTPSFLVNIKVLRPGRCHVQIAEFRVIRGNFYLISN